ncbi:ribosomal protein L23 [Colletotrichum scovillei]|uniref:Large ribosomal subunit protein uL23m n=2 Tax=Colletotrichum acutatum species complex TaxID=2707335 RepID=A0A9P7UH74_9PEZI|nr:ribosomal protein L23 [Colletotrichum scovillei]KXH28286.1 ribosomal protein L23 [Colletotrichum nymphaeae SA-01]KAF4773938.1 ribosomal protein L23 [Colletotrichum scovillei]KAG7048535.1 ribosomal protein L23 [Colletotrichum scovillei]KAG7065724.1 ribosomal protein L23 [Colletotrichum scovillei]KAG7068299.1 ribosomal protein L23 [Colletotrichum scovillei]
MAEALAQAVARQGPASFKLGTKAVYLPNHVVTFVRKDKSPANMATFNVPLTFTKFDIRDYLWNLYNVETTAVRSQVKQSAIERRSTGSGYFRPQSTKVMTVQLTKPFVWPSPPADLEPWNKKLWEARESVSREQYRGDIRKQLGRLARPSKDKESPERKFLRKQAGRILRGAAPGKWDQGTKEVELDSKWDPPKKRKAKSWRLIKRQSKRSVRK